VKAGCCVDVEVRTRWPQQVTPGAVVRFHSLTCRGQWPQHATRCRRTFPPPDLSRLRPGPPRPDGAAGDGATLSPHWCGDAITLIS
jgi:hypothetical protein